ncbi:oxygenase MpaB family protein [Jongsikchunia kroppenstedtii]|uniref:oxygenase MpaB family protein n=1 Tax=Jongsikchunia kroppenstedtii TaxID=1121721 RepID=UPI00036CDDA0|nr:oxygenase MpaB family protein [Jongsikchunia kroppenstedtii]
MMSRVDRLRSMPLEPWLEAGRPLAEAVVLRLRARGVRSDDLLPAICELATDGDAQCRDFLKDIETPPEWADFDRMRPGAAMACRHFPMLGVALLHGGLMTTFCSADAAYILAGTNRLEQDVVRRIFESGTLFFGVLDIDALRPGGSAWETCVRVRLMHTMIRMNLGSAREWPLRGVPINALQTSAGPLFFGSMVLDRLRSSGAVISPAEADGYYLIWRYVTAVLGVPRDLLGDTAEEQAALDARVLEYSFDPDDNSRKLADALLSGLKHLPHAERVPRAVHEVLARHMLGDMRADAMGIDRHRLGSWLARVVARGLTAYGWFQRIPVVAPRLERFGRGYLERLVREGLAGVPADFQPQ